MKILAYQFSKIVVLSGVILISATCQQGNRRPCRYLIPDGYVGWVRIDFKVENEEPLGVEDDHYLYVFPESGHVKTSTDIEYGWATDEFYYYSDTSRTRLESTGWGGGGMIWGAANGWSGFTYEERTATYQHFFVGTEDQFKMYANLTEENGLPEIGNLQIPHAH